MRLLAWTAVLLMTAPTSSPFSSPQEPKCTGCDKRNVESMEAEFERDYVCNSCTITLRARYIGFSETCFGSSQCPEKRCRVRWKLEYKTAGNCTTTGASWTPTVPPGSSTPLDPSSSWEVIDDQDHGYETCGFWREVSAEVTSQACPNTELDYTAKYGCDKCEGPEE